uniref:Uncharacterized protein n=1 Tax=Arundo donax TaxID=35708 RepID=A0A0A9THD3_ARUDO
MAQKPHAGGQQGVQYWLLWTRTGEQ